jgi:hypothetical protein
MQQNSLFKHPSLSLSLSLPSPHWRSHALAGTVTLSKAMREEKNFEISEPRKLYKLAVKTEKYIQSQNTLKTILVCSEAKKNDVLCFDHFLSHF